MSIKDGRELESDFRKLHALYDKWGIAKVFHVPVDTIFKYPLPNKLRAVALGKKLWVDIAGWINREEGPAPVCMELKATEETVLKSGAIKKHQRKLLIESDKQGAVSALFVRSIGEDEAVDFLIPSSKIGARGQLKLFSSRFEKYRVPPIAAGFWTWADVAQTQEDWTEYQNQGWSSFLHTRTSLFAQRS